MEQNKSDEIFYVATNSELVDLGFLVNSQTQLWLDGELPTDTYLDFLDQEWENPEVVLREYEIGLKAMVDKYGTSC